MINTGPINTTMINTTMINTTMINTGVINNRSPRRFGRRTLVAGALAASALLVGSAPARAAGAQAGDLLFTVPSAVRSMKPPAPWQWYGEQPGAPSPITLMARGDLEGDSPQELQTALFAPQLTGRVPDLVLGSPQLTTDGETVQLRQPFDYEPAPGKQQTGVALMITDKGRAGLLVVVGTANVITAGLVDTIMSSARFVS